MPIIKFAHCTTLQGLIESDNYYRDKRLTSLRHGLTTLSARLIFFTLYNNRGNTFVRISDANAPDNVDDDGDADGAAAAATDAADYNTCVITYYVIEEYSKLPIHFCRKNSFILFTDVTIKQSI